MISQIIYGQTKKQRRNKETAVKLGGRVIGKIFEDNQGFRYFPKGKWPKARHFKTIEELKAVLEK